MQNRVGFPPPPGAGVRFRRRAVCGVLVALLTAAAVVVALQPAAAHDNSPQRVGLYMSGGSNSLVSEGTSFTVTAERTRGSNHSSHTGTALIVPIQFSPAGGVLAGRSASADDLMFPASITIPAGATTGTATVQVVDDNIAEEFERAAIVLGQLPSGWTPAPHQPNLSRNDDPNNPGSPGVYFDIRPSDVADLGRLRFRVCEVADGNCPVNGDDGWVETTTPSLTLMEGGSPKSYQYRLTPVLTPFREMEVSPSHPNLFTSAGVDRDRLTCVDSTDHPAFPRGSLVVFAGDAPSQCPHLPKSFGWDQLDRWHTVTHRAGQDSDTWDHSTTVRHRTLARITGHPYGGHYYQDPSGEGWPVRITIIDDDRPDQDVEFSGNGSGWVAMNDGGGVATALPDVLTPGQTYSFQVRLRDRGGSAQRDLTHYLKLRSQSHSEDVKLSLVWDSGAEDSQWWQRLDFRFSSNWLRVYTVRVHVAADATAGNVVFDEYTPPGFWSRAADPGSRLDRRHWRGTVARILPHAADRHRSHNLPVDNAPLIAEVNGHITTYTNANDTERVRRWNLILDRLEGRPGMRDSDIQVWYDTARFRGWQDAITTLPKVQTALAAAGQPPVSDSDEGPILDSDDGLNGGSVDRLLGGSNDARLDEAALIAEVKAHIADFRSRNHANGVRDWNLILDRLEGRTGMSDADIAVWLERSVRHGWQDGITTLPKVQAMLAAPQPVVVPEVNITGSVGGTEGSGVSFTVSAVPPPTADLAVRVAVSASGDFGVLTGAHTMTIPAGQSSVTLTLSSSDDSVDEADGSVTLTLNSDSGGGYTVGSLSSQSVQVLDDDDPPQVIAPLVSVSAGGGVTEGGSALFTLTASPAPASPITVSVTVAASGDFGAVTGSRTVSIPTGGSASFSVATVGDSVDEPDGSVSVTVVDGADYDVGTATATVSVADDDDPPPPVVSVSAGGGVTEGGSALFTVSADAAPAADLPVSVTVAASGDYGVVTGSRTVTIAAGTTSRVLSVATADDSVDEADGSVSVTVVDGADYDVGTATATVNIADDDDPPPENVPDTDDVPDQNSVDPNQPVEVPDTDQVPGDGDAPTPVSTATISIEDASASESASDLVFRVTLSEASNEDVTVQWATHHAHSSDRARGGQGYAYDFWHARGEIVIRAGETTGTGAVWLNQDSRDEPDEVFTVTLSSPVGATLERDEGTMTIIDDD